MSKLQIKNLTVAFNKTEVLKNISVDVADKKFISIIGPSGCGKTTLLKSISGMIKHSTGKILYRGRELSGLNTEIGYVFQNYVSFPWLTVAENIAYGLKNIKNNREKQEKANYFVNAVGLKGYQDAFVSQLSGGMRQRVAIATVLARDPEILLMDEPFSSLDTQTKSLMQELVASIWEENKPTVLFVTHDIEEAIFLSDSVYVMSARPGTIKEMVPIDLPRPRTSGIKLSQEFFEIKKHLTYLVRGEAIKSAGVPLVNISPNSIKIGLHAWPGNIPFYLARELDLFGKSDLHIELVDLEKEENRIDSLVNDNIDLFVSTLDTAILAKEKAKDLKILNFMNKSLGGDGLLANKEIHTFKELKGKKVAIEKGWVGYFFLLYLLQKNGMTSKDIEMSHLKGSDIGASLISKKVDAAVTSEPWLTQAKALSDCNILASTSEYPIIYDVLVAKGKTLLKHRGKIEKIPNVWNEAVEIYKNDTDNSINLVSHTMMISKNELKSQMAKLELYDTKDNANLLDKHKKELEQDISEISDILIKEQQISQKITLDDLTT